MAGRSWIGEVLALNTKHGHVEIAEFKAALGKGSACLQLLLSERRLVVVLLALTDSAVVGMGRRGILDSRVFWAWRSLRSRRCQDFWFTLRLFASVGGLKDK